MSPARKKEIVQIGRNKYGLMTSAHTRGDASSIGRTLGPAFSYRVRKRGKNSYGLYVRLKR